MVDRKARFIMTKEDKRLLLMQATKLATLGVTVERERSNLKKLVERGVPYDSPEMVTALQRFQKVDTEWKLLEAKHLELKNKVRKS